MLNFNEQEVLSKIHNPDTKNEGLELLIKANQEKTYWLIRKIVISHEDANDVVQNTFIKVIKHLENFRGDSKLSTWIFTVAYNEALQFLKSKNRHQVFSINSYEKKLADSLTEDPYFNANEISVKLQKAILSLPIKQRTTFNMRYYDELSFEEISNITHTSIGALKANYHHAFKKIEKYLLEY
jgi:RNA polymerase sigma-70 factor (ECF subfamily)